jgi:methylenetetrahydrofolate dehydrogenase (NADP+)/methenyltetrahydrofolate cyclohydrolase
MIIDGQKIAQKIERELTINVKKLKKIPNLAIVLVGHNPASEIYVQKKQEASSRIGADCRMYRLPANTSQGKLLNLIEKLNKNNRVDGILVQLPLPPGINKLSVNFSISPWKDVDGVNPLNMGFLYAGQRLLVSATVQAIIKTVKYTKINFSGRRAVLVGFSDLIGKPLMPFLVDLGAAITICDKKTKGLAKLTREADLLIVAAGSPKLIKASMVKKGVTVIDVGINRIGKKTVGDVDFENVKKKAQFVTPVPGGVGPVTVAILLKNLIKAAKLGT